MRDISGHTPIWIKGNITNWRPKSFKFFEAWLKHPRFFSFVSNVWKPKVTRGKVAFMLKEKMKILKGKLKTWNNKVFKFLDLEVEKVILSLNALDSKMGEPSQQVTYVFIDERSHTYRRVWESMHFKEIILHKKYKQIWFQEGDSNSRFFRKETKGRFRRNKLVGLLINKGKLDNVSDVRREVKFHFENHYWKGWFSSSYLPRKVYHWKLSFR